MVLILGFFACPLLVWLQELFSLEVRVERGEAKVVVGGGGGVRVGKEKMEDQESEGGAYVSGFTPSLHVYH